MPRDRTIDIPDRPGTPNSTDETDGTNPTELDHELSAPAGVEKRRKRTRSARREAHEGQRDAHGGHSGREGASESGGTNARSETHDRKTRAYIKRLEKFLSVCSPFESHPFRNNYK